MSQHVPCAGPIVLLCLHGCRPRAAGIGPYLEVAFFHRRTRTLLVTDAVISVPLTPPEVPRLPDPPHWPSHRACLCARRAAPIKLWSREGSSTGGALLLPGQHD